MLTQRSIRRKALIIVAVVAIVALSSIVVRMINRSSLNPRAAGIDNAGATLTVFQQRSIPELTADEKDAALKIAMNDPTVTALLADQKYEISGVGVWHTEDLRKIGASVLVAFPEPISFEHDLPSVKVLNGASGSPPYQQMTAHVKASIVRLLSIMVAFDRMNVVGINPVGTDVRFAAPGTSSMPEP